MHNDRITVHDRTVHIHSLEIPSPEVAEFLGRFAEADREAALISALQVGVFCLERAQASRDTDFVRRQVELLLSEVTRAVERIPSATEEAILARIGTANGQVLAPIQNLVAQATQTTTIRLQEVKELLSQEIDPAKDSSAVGRALRTLRDLLDPNRTDSVQGCIQATLAKMSGDDGTFARSIRAAVTDAMQPIQLQVNELAKEVRGREAAAEVLANTPLKGASYEEEVVRELQEWAKSNGAEVHYVGTDNQPGDALVRIPEMSALADLLSIVVEVKDRQTTAGRKAVTDAVTRAMDARGASAAIYVSRTRDGLAGEIGEWAEGSCERGPWIACTGGQLLTAIRFMIVRERIAQMRHSTAELDSKSIDSQVQSVRVSLERVRKITRKIGEVRGGADDIQEEVELLRDEIRSALASIEDAIRKATTAAEMPQEGSGSHSLSRVNH